MRSPILTLTSLAILLVSGLGVTGNLPTASALPTPGVNCQLAGTPASSALRYFPEAEATNDYVGYFEAKQCLAAMAAAFPDRMEVQNVGKSFGLINRQTTQREPLDVIIVEVTNEKSAIPFEDKAKIVLMLSIHGNEKGGREGGLRLMEDFVRNMGIATQPATGHAGKTLFQLMDYAAFILLFPNPDGWATDEPQYADPGTCQPGMYKRQNGRCTDLNRQLPTAGWHQISQGPGRLPMREPEPIAYAAALMNYTNVAYAADIHGMLTPADGCAYGVCSFTSAAAPTGENVYGHFILGLISAGQLNPREMLRSTRLANLLKDSLNENPKFAAWHALPSTSVWGGEFYSWSTVWDTIGYTDSGISGDWFLQDTGLDAPGMDFEMAYNHITFDSAYPAVAQLMNAYHLETVRQIGRAYLEAAVADVQTSIESHGRKTAYLYNPTVLTSHDDKPLDGWAKENPNDDAWDYEHVPYEAAPNDYFRELAPFVKDGDKPGVFEEIPMGEFTLDRLKLYDNLVLAGSAGDQVLASEAALAAVKAFVEGGGNLVLTDESMKVMSRLGVVPEESIQSYNKYAGMTLLTNRNHDFAKHSVKLSRQTYEPVPLGIPVPGGGLVGQSPNWNVNRTVFEAKGGETVGVVPRSTGGGGGGGAPAVPSTQAAPPPQGDTNLGRIKVGAGTISFLGALLPDPTQEHYHPYGLESYATTYFGNLLFYNLLGAEQVFESPPIVLENVGQLRNDTVPAGRGPASKEGGAKEADGTPGFGWILAVAAVAILVGTLGRGARRP